MSKRRARRAKATAWFDNQNQPGDRSFKVNLDLVPDDHPELVALRRKLLADLIAPPTNDMPVFILSSRADREALLQLAIEQKGAIIIPGRK